MTSRIIRTGVTLLLTILPGRWVLAEQRFSQPEFEGGHVIPAFRMPPLPPGVAWEYLNVILVAAALALAVWLVHQRRSRAGMFALALASLAVFGFIRKGCICPVGSIQNVAAGLGQTGYAVPVHVVLLFLLPLVAALFFGRVFCGGVCPLGAIQDLMIVGRLRQLPRWLTAGLSLIRHVYFGLAVLLAATGAGFYICQYDPFVGFFRLSGPPVMLLAGGVMLVLGVFVARPYCRFLCPYGVLLEAVSRYAWRRVSITPDECIRCGLCTESCPFDVIESPSKGTPPEGMKAGRNTLIRRMVLAPAILAAGALLGYGVAPGLARLHATVRLADELEIRAAGRTGPDSLTLQAFDENGVDARAIRAEAHAIVRRFKFGATALGLWIAIAASGALLRLATYRTREIFSPDPGLCLACTRCYGNCPVKRAKGGTLGPD